MIIITIGLCITALGGKDVLNDDGDSSSSSTTNLGNDDGLSGATQQQSMMTTSAAPSSIHNNNDKVTNVITGMFFALLAAIFYAWVYVWTEQLMKGNFSKSSNNLAPSPMGLAAFSGFVGTSITLVYISIFTYNMIFLKLLCLN